MMFLKQSQCLLTSDTLTYSYNNLTDSLPFNRVGLLLIDSGYFLFYLSYYTYCDKYNV